MKIMSSYQRILCYNLNYAFLKEGITITPEENIPIQINKLWGCEKVKAFYYIVGYDVVNIITGHIKTINYLDTKRHYPYVTLETIEGRNKKCLMHHLIALAYIKNESYEVIEHLNDDAYDYSVENLMFSTQSQNVKRAFENGRPNRIEKIYRLITKDNCEYIGTIKELTLKTGIPKGTLYGRIYKESPGEIVKSIVEIKSTEYRTGTDR